MDFGDSAETKTTKGALADALDRGFYVGLAYFPVIASRIAVALGPGRTGQLAGRPCSP
jgi:hypothetical protein